jgi:hypothetical protein
MKATLYGVPASHPSMAGELMLIHKGVDYKRIDFVAAVHRIGVRAVGFDGITVPAVKLDGQPVQGTRRSRPILGGATQSTGPSPGVTRCCSRFRGGSSGRHSGATAPT